MGVVAQRLGTDARVPLRDRGAVGIARSAVGNLFSVTAAINFGAFASSASPFPMTHLVAAVLAVYLLVEARLYLFQLRRADYPGLLSPAFMALVFHFFLSYLIGITAAAFQPSIMTRFGHWLPDLDKALADTVLLAMLAAFCMLRGYALGRPIARVVRRVLARVPQMRRVIRPHLALVVGIQVAYLALVAYAIDLGLYGLLGTDAARAQYVDVVQYLKLALAAGTLSYFLILLHYFEFREQQGASFLYGFLVTLLIALHVITGALSAFKSQIVFPFVIAGFAYFLATRRTPWRFVGVAVIALIMAYAIVEPFRAYLRLQSQPPATVAEAVNALGTATELREQFDNDSGISRGEAIAGRFDLLGMTTLAVDYVDRGHLQSDMRQQFRDSILLAPILAYVPRALWPDKPSYSRGVWFNQTVRGRSHDESTSVGMGPIGYLYMSGGSMAVVLGFVGFGLLQALIFEGVGRSSAGGLIVFLSVASTLIMVPSSYGPAVTGVLRMLPVAFVAQLLLLRRSPLAKRDNR